MTWGARSLVRNAAMILLLKVLSPSAAEAEHSSGNGTGDTYTAVALAVRGKRENLPDILIEHDNEGAELPYFPLLVGLVIMGGLVVLVLLLLACHLLLRLAESACSKYRYRRLRPDESELGTTVRAKPSHAFTYVDLSYNECAHADHDEEESPAPRFGVNVKTAGKIDGRDGDLRRKQRVTPTPAPRRSQQLRMGLPTRVEEDATEVAAAYQERAEESITSIQIAARAQNPDEPPKKKICSQHVSRAPRSRSGGRNDEDGLNVYAERCTQFKSVAPAEFEINVRDRLVRGRPQGGAPSPRRSGLAAVTEEVVPGVWAETQKAHYPDIGSARSRGYQRTLNSSSNPLYNLHETTSQTQPLEGTDLYIPDDSMSQQASTHEQHGTSMSGHGRYEQHALDEKGSPAVVSAANLPLQSYIDSELQDRRATVLAPSSRKVPPNTSVEVPDNEDLTHLSPSTPSLKSPSIPSTPEDKAGEAGESAVSAQKSSETSNALGRPIHLDKTLVPPGVTSPRTTVQGTPLKTQSSEMRVQVPKMIAYFDKPPTVHRFKAKLDGSSTERSVPNKPRYPYVPSEASTKKDVLVSLPSPGKTALVDETIKLPASPPVQLQLKSPGEKSALAVEALQPVRKRHDVQDTTESFSVDESSPQRTSGSGVVSANDMSSGQVEMANSRSSFVLTHSKPAMETSLVAPAERSVSTKDVHAVEDIPLPCKRSVVAVSTSMLPAGEKQVQTRQELTLAGAALVSRTDTPGPHKLAPLDSNFHLDETPLPRMPADKSDGAAYTPQPILAEKDGSMLHPTQREVIAEDTAVGRAQAYSTAEEAGGEQRGAVVSKRDAALTEEESAPPATISPYSGQASLVMKEPLDVDLGTEETGMEEQMMRMDMKERRPLEANTPYPLQNQTPVPGRDGVVLSRVENEVPSHKTSTSVIEMEPAERKALVARDEQRPQLLATASPAVLMQPVPLPSRDGAVLRRSDNAVTSHHDGAGTGVVEAEAVGKPVTPKQSQPSFLREGEPPSSTAVEGRIFRTPVSSTQDQKSTAVVIRPGEVPEEYHTGPFSDSNRRVSEGSVALKEVNARRLSIRHRRSLDELSPSGHQVQLSEQPKSSSSWVDSPSSSAEPPQRSTGDLTGTHSEITSLTNLDVTEDEDHASREIFPYGHPQSVNEVQPHLIRGSTTAVSVRDEPATPDYARHGPVSLSQAQHILPNPDNLPDTKLPEKNILLDSSVVPPYRRRTLSGVKQPLIDSTKPTKPLHSLGSPGSKSKTDFSQPPVEIPPGEMSIRGIQDKVVSAPRHSVVQAEPKPTVKVNADQQKLLTLKPHDVGQVSFPSHPSESELTDKPKASTIQPMAASRKLLTKGRDDLLPAPSDDRVIATQAVRPVESNAFVEPHEEPHGPALPMHAAVSQWEPSPAQLAAAPGTLETRDKGGVVVAPSDSSQAVPRAVGPIEEAELGTSVQPHDDLSVVQSGAEISQQQPSSVQPATAPHTLGARDEAGLSIAPSDSFAAATRQVRPSEGSELITSVQPHEAVPSDAEISQRPPSTVQLAAASGVLAASDRRDPADISDSSVATASANRPSEVSESTTSIQKHKDYPVPSDAADISRESSSLLQAAAQGTLVTSDKSEHPITPSDGSVEAARTAVPGERLEKGTSLAPHQIHSDAEGSHVLLARETPASPDVFFGRTTPVPAHGSKDLIVLQTDPTADALQEKRTDRKLTDVDKPSASNDKTEKSKK